MSLLDISYCFNFLDWFRIASKIFFNNLAGLSNPAGLSCSEHMGAIGIY
jgi:hypothetical protein